MNTTYTMQTAQSSSDHSLPHFRPSASSFPLFTPQYVHSFIIQFWLPELSLPQLLAYTWWQTDTKVAIV